MLELVVCANAEGAKGAMGTMAPTIATAETIANQESFLRMFLLFNLIYCYGRSFDHSPRLLKKYGPYKEAVTDVSRAFKGPLILVW